MPIPQLAQTVVSVALGQDHTLAVTKAGDVLSWGLNRFCQLGYVIELPLAASGVSLGRSDEPIQASPRKIFGPLKKENVIGVAACKTASACWTDREVFTWGTNHGQLGQPVFSLCIPFLWWINVVLGIGYDKVAQPVQVLPRKVTKITQPVLDIAITDTAMACLLGTQDVVCIWNDRHFKIKCAKQCSFPLYRPLC
jgi:inhibitor of Bruton tyrosine kinase